MTTIYPENIPAELKDLPHWCVWKREIGDGKPAKVPYQVTGEKAKSNDPRTWGMFTVALAAYQDLDTFAGVCFMMPTEPNGIIFIDIDHCIIDGVIEPWAEEIVKRFNSYTERSQSGNGLHILIKATKPIKRCRRVGSPFEIYDSLRPAYLTGDVI
jgi:putative DNA primase/helicase